MAVVKQPVETNTQWGGEAHLPLHCFPDFSCQNNPLRILFSSEQYIIINQ